MPHPALYSTQSIRNLRKEILAAAFHHNPVIFGLLALAALMTSFYMFRSWFLTFTGMPREKVRLERFEASGNDAVPIEPPEEGDVIPSEITIHFEGKAHKVPYRKGLSILEAARAAGLNPLSSCEEGFCASCAAKRIKGKIVLAKNDIYTPDDLANNWILTCQGHCFGPEVEITYDVV